MRLVTGREKRTYTGNKITEADYNLISKAANINVVEKIRKGTLKGF